MKDSALYIHIPFCDHKCIYCDFYSIITTDNISPFLTSLKKEIDYYSEFYSQDRYFTSIYFGGGTPSLMEPEYIRDIINHLKKRFSISGSAEITLEANPGTIDKNKLKAFLNAGINRISIGIQSFNQDELKFLTRIHNSSAAINTTIDAFYAGFENISVDLIFNLPGQTKEKWLSNLKTVSQLPVKHISTYSLILESGTILNKMVLDGKIEMENEDCDAELYEMTIDFMESQGFIQYEVSNFSMAGFECIHNKAYWESRDYISFGPSAHSFVNGKRWWNFSSLRRYISEIENNYKAVSGYEVVTNEQFFVEYIMLSLRSKGIYIPDLYSRFGDDWINSKQDYLFKLQQNKFIMMNQEYIRLTKNGYALCDEILSKFSDIALCLV